MRRWVVLLILALAHVEVEAGQACSPEPVTPGELETAVAMALAVRHEAERRNAPAALVARVGTDLAEQGLVYSHVGVLLRDRPEGRWSVVHLLNECGSAESNLYVEGLVNFFADHLAAPQARLIWLDEALARQLADEASESTWLALHQAHYNLLSRPGKQRSQNSTAWVLELLAAAMRPGADDRGTAQAWLSGQRYHPDVIHVPYSKRLLGGLFASNVEFTEHSVKDRLGGRYQTTTVRSIVQFLQSQGQVQAQSEWQGGSWVARPGAL
ncbi:DUF2145 domain-containing protein [Pseudomarimonas arenosa]|uniref:DUF2145 domain-containing protein n=1 Tax=Pseudomarimonas arenosa TaxID=2774145 RepID=A0AAW3ZMF1_9GAMM|nr:DUF2145 domain-containing protein [Pseudomarimonas arenosa]MBD8526655.1 DUF2145 domain-containing protein [Pseudomarimonas arenosa]